MDFEALISSFTQKNQPFPHWKCLSLPSSLFRGGGLFDNTATWRHLWCGAVYCGAQGIVDGGWLFKVKWAACRHMTCDMPNTAILVKCPNKWHGMIPSTKCTHTCKWSSFFVCPLSFLRESRETLTVGGKCSLSFHKRLVIHHHLPREDQFFDLSTTANGGGGTQWFEV